MDARDQRGVDARLIDLDGSENKGNLGANAILGASLAVARPRRRSRAAALPLRGRRRRARAAGADDERHQRRRPRRRTRSTSRSSWSSPSARARSRGAAHGAETFHALKALLHGPRPATGVGDEGGFAPDLRPPTRRSRPSSTAAESAASRAVAIALDPASTESSATAPTTSRARGARCRPAEMVDYLAELVDRIPGRLDRGRAGRGRLGRLAPADRAARQGTCSSSARHLRSRNPAGSSAASTPASGTRS
jgi:enolase